MHRDGSTPKLVNATQVLVTTAKSGTIFRPPAGPSKAGARKELFG
jgi:hypothetical protein